MTDSDIKSLRAYLTECLEPSRDYAAKKALEYGAEEVRAKTLGNGHDAEYNKGLRKFYEGKRAAYNDSIAELQELFPDELKEDDHPEENASEARHSLHCKCAECEDGRGDREYEISRDRKIEREGL